MSSSRNVMTYVTPKWVLSKIHRNPTTVSLSVERSKCLQNLEKILIGRLPGSGREVMRTNCFVGTGFYFGAMGMFWNYNTVNVRYATEWVALKWLILHYCEIHLNKLFFLKKKINPHILTCSHNHHHFKDLYCDQDSPTEIKEKTGWKPADISCPLLKLYACPRSLQSWASQTRGGRAPGGAARTEPAVRRGLPGSPPPSCSPSCALRQSLCACARRGWHRVCTGQTIHTDTPYIIHM